MDHKLIPQIDVLTRTQAQFSDSFSLWIEMIKLAAIDPVGEATEKKTHHSPPFVHRHLIYSCSKCELWNLNENVHSYEKIYSKMLARADLFS